MLAGEVLPYQAYLPIGNPPDLTSTLLLAKDKVVAPLGKRGMQAEGNTQFRTTLNHPAAALGVQTRQCSRAGIEGHQQLGIFKEHLGADRYWTCEQRQERGAKQSYREERSALVTFMLSGS